VEQQYCRWSSLVNCLQFKRNRFGLWWDEVSPKVATALVKAKWVVAWVTTGRATDSWGE